MNSFGVHNRVDANETRDVHSNGNKKCTKNKVFGNLTWPASGKKCQGRYSPGTIIYKYPFNLVFKYQFLFMTNGSEWQPNIHTNASQKRVTSDI